MVSHFYQPQHPSTKGTVKQIKNSKDACLLTKIIISEDMAYIEKRTAHNALERQRREGLNSKFQELAHVLPALQQIRRPSKSMIVAKSLEFGKVLYYQISIIKA